MKKEEMMLKATQMLAKGKFKLKKASPTIMIVGAAIGGVTAAGSARRKRSSQSTTLRSRLSTLQKHRWTAAKCS